MTTSPPGARCVGMPELRGPQHLRAWGQSCQPPHCTPPPPPSLRLTLSPPLPPLSNSHPLGFLGEKCRKLPGAAGLDAEKGQSSRGSNAHHLKRQRRPKVLSPPPPAISKPISKAAVRARDTHPTSCTPLTCASFLTCKMQLTRLPRLPVRSTRVQVWTTSRGGPGEPEGSSSSRHGG